MLNKIEIIQNEDVSSCDIDISKEEWLVLLKDKAMPVQYKEALIKFFYQPEHRGSCTAVCNELGGSPQSLNSYITRCGEYVQKRLNRFQIIRSNGKPCYWLVPMCEGKDLPAGSEGTFEWRLRPELVEAIKEYLYWYLIQQYKVLRRELPLRDHEYNWDELYKWELITASNGKSPWEIVKASVEYPNDTTKGGFKNLVYPTGYGKSMKYAVENQPDKLKSILQRLTDEAHPLTERLSEFKNSMEVLLPSKGYSSKANDERTAATILTCFSPDNYTFYKHDELYNRLCKYLGENMQKAGLCYQHYLALISPLAEMADLDKELQDIITPMLEGQRLSRLLLAQDILWMLLRSNPKRLGFLYNILFNSDNPEETMNNYNIYIELLKANKNLILTGAPGTGKTFMAKAIAEEMGAEIGFVQFHPSYDYTDFVEGLRPKNDGNGNVGFERRDGVFKEFCKKANSVQSKSDNFIDKSSNCTSLSIEEAYDRLVDDLRSNGKTIQFKTPTGIPFGIKVYGDSKLIIADGKYEGAHLSKKMVVGFYNGTQAGSYYKSHCNEVIKHLQKKYIESSEKEECLLDEEVELSKSTPYVFIIDEINRGEISKIFGELFFSIDPGYRGEYDENGNDNKVNTQYQNLIPKEGDKDFNSDEADVFRNGFYIPKNVYIIGTMNDIDRSVESMDFAMRRRFAWKEVTAEDSMQMLNGISNETALKNRMRNLNRAILNVNGLGKAYQVGAAYFKKYELYNDFELLWQYHLEGLLAEYLRGSANAEKELAELKKAYDNETAKDADTNNDNG